MKINPISHTEPSVSTLPEDVLEALGRFQVKPPNILGSIYIYDLVDQRTLCTSCSVATLLDYTADDIQFLGDIGLASLIHPDDLNRVSEHYQRFATLRWGQTISIHYRMKQKDENWCWLRSQETPLVMSTDRFPLQILGIIQPRDMEWLL